MLHNAPSLDLSSIILFWIKSRKIDHISWIDMKLNIPIKLRKKSGDIIGYTKNRAD